MPSFQNKYSKPSLCLFLISSLCGNSLSCFSFVMYLKLSQHVSCKIRISSDSALLHNYPLLPCKPTTFTVCYPHHATTHHLVHAPPTHTSHLSITSFPASVGLATYSLPLLYLLAWIVLCVYVCSGGRLTPASSTAVASDPSLRLRLCCLFFILGSGLDLVLAFLQSNSFILPRINIMNNLISLYKNSHTYTQMLFL